MLYRPSRVAGFLQDVGFDRPGVRLSPFVDQAGRGLHVLRNMAGYINTFETMPADRVAELMGQVEQALEDGRFPVLPAAVSGDCDQSGRESA